MRPVYPAILVTLAALFPAPARLRALEVADVVTLALRPQQDVVVAGRTHTHGLHLDPSRALPHADAIRRPHHYPVRLSVDVDTHLRSLDPGLLYQSVTHAETVILALLPALALHQGEDIAIRSLVLHLRGEDLATLSLALRLRDV